MFVDGNMTARRVSAVILPAVAPNLPDKHPVATVTDLKNARINTDGARCIGPASFEDFESEVKTRQPPDGDLRQRRSGKKTPPRTINQALKPI